MIHNVWMMHRTSLFCLFTYFSTNSFILHLLLNNYSSSILFLGVWLQFELKVIDICDCSIKVSQLPH